RDGLYDLPLGDVRDDEAVQVGQGAVEGLLVVGHGQGAGHAADRDFGEVGPRVAIDPVDFVVAHRGDPEVVVATGVVAVVRHLDGQVLHDLALVDVHQVHAVAAADGHADQPAVRGGGALVGQPGQLDRLDHLVGSGVDDAERVIAFDGGKQAPPVG